VSDLPALDPDRLVAPADWVVEVLGEAASTNALVAARAREGAGAGLVVVAAHQTAGRGRLDRTWQTPPRTALTFSVLLRPALAGEDWPWLPLLAGYATLLALRTTGADAALKWPNDVLLADHKVAGILTERIETPQGPVVVVGIGLNVGMTHAELPVETATSLAVEGIEADRTDLLGALLGALRTEYDALLRGGPGQLRTAYAGACATVGREVRVELPAGATLSGRATGIDEGGRLLVETASGIRAVSAGDVVHAALR
jgi:BirA family biotin operon repressor/biotin-[acetyl-CoA-carboxylase] ligase